MRKISKALVFVIVFTVFSAMLVTPVGAAYTEAANILANENCGFEDGKLQSGNQSSGVSLSFVPEAAHNGSYGVAFTATGSIHNLRTEYKIRNTVDTWYTAGYFVKAKDSSSVGKTASIRFQVNTEPVAYKDSPAIKLTTDWQLVTFDYKVPANQQMRVGTIIQNGAAVYVDDFFLEENPNVLIEENCGFESGKLLSGAQSANAATFDNTNARTGNYCLKVTSTGSIHNLRTEYKTRNTVDTWYKAGYWIKAADSASVGKSAKVRFQLSSDGTSANAVSSDGTPIKLTTEWQLVTYEYKVPANHQMRIGAIIDSGAAVYVDDFFLEPTDNILIGENSGFESGTLKAGSQSAGAATIEKAAAHSGSYGAKVTSTGSIHNLRTEYKTRNTVDTWYKAHYWVKAAGDSAVGKTAELRFQSSSDGTSGNAVSSNGFPVTISKDWQLVTHEYKVPANHQMRIGVIIENGAVAYVDDFYLAEFTPTEETLAFYGFEGIVGTSPASGFTNGAMTKIAKKIDDGVSSNGIENGNAMQFTPHATDARTSDSHLSAAVEKGIVEYSFDFYAEEGSPLFQIYLKSVKTKNVISSYINRDGCIGEHGNGDIIKNVETNKWHSIKYRLNMYDKSFTLTLDGTTYTTNLKGEKLHFRDETAESLRYATFYVYPEGANPDAVIQLDNYKVQKDIKEYNVSLITSGGMKVEDFEIYNCSIGMPVSEFLNLLSATPSDAEVKVLDKDGNEKTSSDLITKTDFVRVIYAEAGLWYDYKLMPDYRIDFRSLQVKGDEYFETTKISKPGTATVKALVTNNTDEDKTFAVYGTVVGDKLYDVELSKDFAVKAGEVKEVNFTLDIPDAVSTANLKLILAENADMITPLAECEKKLVFTSQEISMPNIFSDHMVLQRSEKVNIFGLAPTGTPIEVTFGDVKVTGMAENGEFCVQLPEMEGTNAGKNLVVNVGDKTFTYTDVVVGDVFYGSGQSNMEMPVSNFSGLYSKLGVVPNVRCFDVEKITTLKEREAGLDEAWRVLSSSNYTTAGATMYSIAAALRNLGAVEEDIPIGFVKCAWGGTKLSRWISSGIAANEYSNFYNSYLLSELDSYKVRVTDLYYAMVRSVMPYTFKAAVWYQGESDVYNQANYDKALAASIEQLRADLGYNIPYFIIQLPGYGVDKNWDNFRLVQENAAKLAGNAYIVVTNDTGAENDIHPTDKDVVGERAARQIIKQVYNNNKIPYSGPVYKSASVSGGKVTLSFDFVNDGVHGGLCSMADGALPGFEVSSDGTKWYSADASISGDNVILESADVSAPVYVRYDWVNAPLKSLATSSTDATGLIKLPLAPFCEQIN